MRQLLDRTLKPGERSPAQQDVMLDFRMALLIVTGRNWRQAATPFAVPTPGRAVPAAPTPH